MNQVFRPGTDDEAFWASAQTEYDLPAFDADDVFLDIGCNIGAVTYRAHELGSRNIWSYEACPENFKLAEQNALLSGVRLFNRAVVGVGRPKQMDFPVGNNSFFIPESPTQVVETTTLDEIVAEIGRPIRYMKMDVEGSEWEILYTFEGFDQIEEIRGEYHEPCIVWWKLAQLPGLPPYSWPALSQFLNGKGFTTFFQPPAAGSHILGGEFHAWR